MNLFTFSNANTYTINIYVGLRHGYSDIIYSIDDVRNWLQNYCNDEKFGVTLTSTEFIYVNGKEPGCIVGIIEYPRFPKGPNTLREHAVKIAKGLMILLNQDRLSIVCSDKTFMLEKSESDY